MGKKKTTGVASETLKKEEEKSAAINQRQRSILFAKIYREYSRRKYNKYKLKYTKLR